MAVLEGDNLSYEEASYQSSAPSVEPGGIYRVDLSTGQVAEVAVGAPDEAAAHASWASIRP